MRTGKESFSFRLSYLLLAVTAVAAAVCAAVCSQMIKHLHEVLEYEVRREANRVISEAVERAVSEEGGSFVMMTRAEDGTVTSAEADPIRLNSLENRLKAEINESLEELHDSKLYIRSGTLTGIAIFSGRGIKLSIGLEQHGTADVKLKSCFDSAGINQTRCQLTLEITAKILAVTGSSSQVVTVTDEYIISDTVIVGKQPVYLN